MDPPAEDPRADHERDLKKKLDDGQADLADALAKETREYNRYVDDVTAAITEIRRSKLEARNQKLTTCETCMNPARGAVDIARSEI